MSSSFGFDDLSWQYSLEDLDSFKDLPHLVNLTLSKIHENIDGAVARFFVLQQEFREYREVNREGSFTVPEDSNFVTYLAIKNKIISRKNIAEEEFFKDSEEEILKFLFSTELGVNVILPVVYRFRLLGFITVSLDEEARESLSLSPSEKTFFDLLKESLRVNLYAAILIDNRFYELLSLVDLTKKLESFSGYKEISEGVMELVQNIVSYDCGVFYQYDVPKDSLFPISVFGMHSPLPLAVGESVSGYVFQKQKPAIINNINEHVFFNEINSENFIRHSFLSIPIQTAKRPFGVLTVCKNKERDEFSVDQLYLLRIVTSFIADYMENKLLYFELEKSYFDTVSALSTALEAKDKYTRGHSERVMRYSVGIAKKLGLSPEKIREIKYAAVLHDIGKIGISENIITKPGRLTGEEYQVIQLHPEIGAGILSSIHFLQFASKLVHYHHEKFDGSGYYGKKEGEYPWETTIIALADAFDALSSDRPYRAASTPEVAIKELKRSVGNQFQENVFYAFVDFLKDDGILRKSFPI